MHRHASERRRHGERGAAMVEFAFVGVLLFFLLFGIINFGVLLSVKNSITQAANEGARSSVSVFARNGLAYADVQSGVGPQAKVLAEEAAIERMRERLASLEGDVGGPFQTRCSEPLQCPTVSDNPSITYLARVHDCVVTDRSLLTDLSVTVDTDEDTNDCMFTQVTYDQGSYRLLAPIPLLASVMPDTISDRADVALT